MSNSPDLNPVDYRIWRIISNESTRQKRRTWMIWCSVWLMCGLKWSRALFKMSLTSGAGVSPCLYANYIGTLWIFAM